MLDASQRQTRAGYAPFLAKNGPFPTLVSPRKGWHGLTLEKNRQLKLELGLSSLEEALSCLRWTLLSPIQNVSGLRKAFSDLKLENGTFL